MKNRKKTSSAFGHAEFPIDRNSSEKRLKKRNHSSTSFPINIEFLQQHSKLFKKNSYSCGDADTYFKHILRNYDHLDLKGFHSDSEPITSRRSADLSSRKQEKKITKLLFKKKQKEAPPRTVFIAPTDVLPETREANTKRTPRSVFTVTNEPEVEGEKSRHPSEESEELDLDVFYSPSSHTLTSSKSSASTLTDQVAQDNLDLEELVAGKMVLDAEMDEEVGEEEGEGEGGEEEMVAPPEVVLEETEPLTTDGEETTDDDLKEVEDMIKQASAELDKVAEENQELVEGIEAEEKTEEETKLPEGSSFKFDPAIDAAVLRELEDAENQAKETAKIILELKNRVTELLKKDKTTEAEARELEAKNKELRTQMMMFEEKTKRIQWLIGQTNLFESMAQPKTPLQVKHNEDVLPKVIVCGMTENNIPKLIVCDDKRRRSCKNPTTEDVNLPMSVVPKFAKRLSDSYCMQEKLANENANLEGTRYQLQSDLLNKDQTIETLQRKLCGIQTEMRMICKENSLLNDKINQVCSFKQQEGDRSKKRAPCGKDKGTCPAEIETRLNQYSETTKMLEKQLGDMESDVKNMQSELTAVQNEREHLEQHRKIIICPPACMPPCLPCPPHPCGPFPPCSPYAPCSPCPPCPSPAEQQLRELKEQYFRLQDDFKGKLTEVAGLRADNEKLKDTSAEAEEARKQAEEKVKDYEKQLKVFKNEKHLFQGSKEQLVEQEQQLNVAKQRFREAQDELEELRAFIQDQQSQVDDYRNKYLESQQEVEEQKRHIDILEMDANRVNDEVNIEIQRVKNQFQEKLTELLPLPDLLKTTQLKLQEVQQMHLLAERNNEALERDLQIYKDKVIAITNQMEQARGDQDADAGQKATLAARLEELQTKFNDLQDEADRLSVELNKKTEQTEEAERKVQEKLHEIAQLEAQLESVREESARQVARNKERCETVRRSMQNQISDLERQLVQSRAQARSAQKDRDEIRQKMQSQINNLHENFEDAQMRIRSLQGHVNFLKNSYNTVMPAFGGDSDSVSDHQDPCNCGNAF